MFGIFLIRRKIRFSHSDSLSPALRARHRLSTDAFLSPKLWPGKLGLLRMQCEICRFIHVVLRFSFWAAALARNLSKNGEKCPHTFLAQHRWIQLFTFLFLKPRASFLSKLIRLSRKAFHNVNTS